MLNLQVCTLCECRMWHCDCSYNMTSLEWKRFHSKRSFSLTSSEHSRVDDTVAGNLETMLVSFYNFHTVSNYSTCISDAPCNSKRC